MMCMCVFVLLCVRHRETVCLAVYLCAVNCVCAVHYVCADLCVCTIWGGGGHCTLCVYVCISMFLYFCPLLLLF